MRFWEVGKNLLPAMEMGHSFLDLDVGYLLPGDSSAALTGKAIRTQGPGTAVPMTGEANRPSTLPPQSGTGKAVCHKTSDCDTGPFPFR